jgi:hypothetical protein
LGAAGQGRRKMICYAESREYDRLQQTAAPAPGPGPWQAPRHLFSWLRSEISIPTQIHVLLLLYIILVGIQMVFVLWRRCRSSAFIKYPLLLAYSLAQPVVAYTVVLVYYSSFKTSTYLLADMIVLVLAGGRVNYMTAYHVDDNKRYMTDLFQQTLLLVNFVSMYIFLYKIEKSWASATFQLLIIVCNMFYGSMNVGKIYGRMMASSFSDKGSLHLQEYMKTEHTESPEYDPQSLRGYNYLVCSNDNVNVTVSQAWMSNEGLLGSSEGTRLTELCLSFALFQLLRRRFFKVACPEAKLLKTHDLIFKGMLLDVEENCQAYRIIETELAFIHDHFFTTSTFQHTTLGQLSMIANIIFIISYTLLIRTNIRNFLSWKDEPMLPMNSRNIPGGRVGIIIIGVTMLLS